MKLSLSKADEGTRTRESVGLHRTGAGLAEVLTSPGLRPTLPVGLQCFVQLHRRLCATFDRHSANRAIRIGPQSRIVRRHQGPHHHSPFSKASTQGTRTLGSLLAHGATPRTGIHLRGRAIQISPRFHITTAKCSNPAGQPRACVSLLASWSLRSGTSRSRLRCVLLKAAKCRTTQSTSATVSSCASPSRASQAGW